MQARIALETAEIDVTVGHATRAWHGRTAYRVRLTAGDLVGEGEVVPLAGYSPDEDVRAALLPLHDTTIELDDDVPQAFDTLGPSARFALSTAALDLRSRARGMPLHAFLGGGAQRVPVSQLLPLTGLEIALDDAEREGITAFKLKIGASLEQELTAVARVRARMPGATIRVDANGALPRDRVQEILAALADLDVLYVEEPVPLAELTEIPKWPLPLALDESLPRLDRDARRRWLESGALGAVILKAALLGGVDRALALGHLAAEHGVPCSASHLFDGYVGLAAAAELALALPLPAAAGVARHAGLGAFPARGIAAFSGAVLAPHRAPGLGLS